MKSKLDTMIDSCISVLEKNTTRRIPSWRLKRIIGCSDTNLSQVVRLAEKKSGRIVSSVQAKGYKIAVTPEEIAAETTRRQLRILRLEPRAHDAHRAIDQEKLSPKLAALYGVQAAIDAMGAAIGPMKQKLLARFSESQVEEYEKQVEQAKEDIAPPDLDIDFEDEE